MLIVYCAVIINYTAHICFNFNRHYHFIMNYDPNRKLNVMHIISGDLWAGAETMACNLLRRLRENQELSIYVIILNEGRLAKELQDSGLTVSVIEEYSNSFWQILRKIISIVKEFHPDIIHSHRNKENLLAFLASRFYLTVKLVSTLHGLPELVDNFPKFNHWIKIKLNLLILSKFFHTVAVSIDIRNVLINRFNFSNDTVEAIHNGIEITDLIDKDSNNLKFVIGSSGRLFPIKDYPLMVEIARLVLEKYPENIRFELAGDGPEMDSILALIQTYGLGNNFSLLGHQDDMARFYNGLDLYLNTSVHEGIPMTILEAMSHGLPVVAPSVGGIVEIVDNGVNGFLIQSRNPFDYAARCISLFENEAQRQKMSEAAIATARVSFSAELMASKYFNLYQNQLSPCNRLR